MFFGEFDPGKNKVEVNEFLQLQPIWTKSGRVVGATSAFMLNNNEDSSLINLERDTFAVVDGMGGYSGGAEAARAVVLAIEEGLKSGKSPFEMHLRAHNIMKEFGVIEGGACYFAATIVGKKLNIWYAGDVTGMVINPKGEIIFRSRDEGLQYAPRGSKVGHPTLETVQVMNYDRVLIASDGLWDNVDTEEVIKLACSLPIEQVIKELSLLAEKGMRGGVLKNGGYGKKDNLTIILYEILPVPMRKYGKELSDASPL